MRRVVFPYRVTVRWLRDGEHYSWTFGTYRAALLDFLKRHKRQEAPIIELTCPGDHP